MSWPLGGQPDRLPSCGCLQVSLTCFISKVWTLKPDCLGANPTPPFPAFVALDFTFVCASVSPSIKSQRSSVMKMKGDEQYLHMSVWECLNNVSSH